MSVGSTKYKILKSLSKNGCESRVELAKKLKLSKPSITDNVNKLLESGVILESGEGEASKVGGRKPIMLEINATSKYIVSVDLAFKNPRCALGNLNHELLHEEIIEGNNFITEDERLAAIGQVVQLLLKKGNITIEKLGCIVLSLPGILKEDDTLKFSSPQFTKWTSLNIKEYLKREFTIPVIVKNDVNMALVAEMELGKRKQYQNIAYISCGLGIGSGIALKRKLYEGEHMAAGEIGYTIDMSSLETGANIEDTINVEAVLAKIRRDVADGMDTLLAKKTAPISFDDIIEAYQQGDNYVKQIFYDVGIRLGVAVANMVTLLDLGIVIFGGLYSEFFDDLLKGVNEVLNKVKIVDTVIETSVFGAQGSIYGAFIIGADYIMSMYSE